MVNHKQFARLRRSVKEWNTWRRKNPWVQVELSGAHLHEADLNGADLHDADLTGADFSGAALRKADFTEAYLGQADLSYADLGGAGLDSAYLRLAFIRGANLCEVDLANADLTLADLNGANLTQALVFQTVFGDTNLKDAVGLNSCAHIGPSMIDHATIAQSWPIPEVFLRGCGLPDNLIEYLPSLLSDGAIQFYSCFISYSTKDQDFADRLHADLQNKGVRCWFAPHDVQSGKKLHEQIDEAIRRYERLLVILSANSMNSTWVETEIRNARRRERNEKKRVLFPVRLASYDALRQWKLFDADEGRDLAVEIREYYIPDFSEWKSHDLYQKEFKKLLRDLRMDGAK